MARNEGCVGRVALRSVLRQAMEEEPGARRMPARILCLSGADAGEAGGLVSLPRAARPPGAQRG
jgi:hypothetical protein